MVLTRMFFAGILTVMLSIASATAKESPPPEPSTDVAEEGTPDAAVQPKLDLGLLEVKNLEPTRNQTSKISFGLHLTLPVDTDPALVKKLAHWQHRLREQVIVAIRVAELGDYLDPQLIRLRKQILYRVNRVLIGTQAEDVLLANFTYSNE